MVDDIFGLTQSHGWKFTLKVKPTRVSKYRGENYGYEMGARSARAVSQLWLGMGWQGMGVRGVLDLIQVGAPLFSGVNFKWDRLVKNVKVSIGEILVEIKRRA